MHGVTLVILSLYNFLCVTMELVVTSSFAGDRPVGSPNTIAPGVTRFACPVLVQGHSVPRSIAVAFRGGKVGVYFYDGDTLQTITKL